MSLAAKRSPLSSSATSRLLSILAKPTPVSSGSPPQQQQQRSLILHPSFNPSGARFISRSDFAPAPTFQLIAASFSTLPSSSANSPPQSQSSSLQSASKVRPYGVYSADKESAPLVDIAANQLHRIKDFPAYQSIVDNPDVLIVALFTARCSTWSKILLNEFQALVSSGNSDTSSQPGEPLNGQSVRKVFVHVDVDECPRAAYHADVDDVPTIVMMMRDDAYRHKIAPLQRSIYDQMMSELHRKISAFNRLPASAIQNLQSRTAWYDHNIRIDNLNVHRVGWPTR